MAHHQSRILDIIDARYFRIGEDPLPPDEPETWWFVGPDAPGWAVSTIGRAHTGYKISKQYYSPQGLTVTLRPATTKIRLNTLMGLTFFGPRIPRLAVIHIDQNRRNNKLSNLRRETPSGFMKPFAKARERPVIATNELSVQRIFPNAKEAASWFGRNRTLIYHYVKKQLPLEKEGHHWTFQFANDITRTIRREPKYPNAVWLEAAEFPDYECSDQGEIRRKFSPFVIQQHASSSAYYQLQLAKNGQPTRASVHRVICMTFRGPPPTTKHQVNHLNENKFDNRAENLEWTLKNAEYSLGIPCQRLLADGSWQGFPSLSAGALAVDRSHNSIRDASTGKLKTCGGYTWRLVE
jgi:hypothetical protein